jgi:hypothetical protein
VRTPSVLSLIKDWPRVWPFLPIVVALLLVSGRVHAAATTDYPLTARFTFTESVRATCGARAEQPADASLVGVVERRLHEAYPVEIRRMFRDPPSDGPADLEIVISSACVDLQNAPEGRLAVVATRATITGVSGSRIAEVTARGDAPAFGDDWALNAGDRAAQSAASNFEAAFANSDEAINWLLARDLEPIGSTVAWPPRGDWVAFADAGGGFMAGAGEETAGGLLAHFGFEYRWFVIQGVFGTWSSSFVGATSTINNPNLRLNADLGAYDLGVEGGGVLRLGHESELRAGAGVHHLWGSGEARNQPVSSSYSVTSPAVFAAAQTTFTVGRSGFRFRLGVEARKYFNATVGLPELSRTIPAADVFVGVFAGFEISTSRAKR